MRKVLGLAAGLVTVSYPGFAVLLSFLSIFWQSLGNLALNAHNGYQLIKTQKAHMGSRSAKVDRNGVRMQTTRSGAGREVV